MDIDEYYGHVGDFADTMNAQEAEFEPFLASLKGNSQTAEDCVSFRQAELTESDVQRLSPYLEIGYFHDNAAPDPLRECAWWAFCFDVTQTSVRHLRQAECTPYDHAQPLFQAQPYLFQAIRARKETGALDLELIDERALINLDGEVYATGSGFAKLSPSLPPRIAEIGRKHFADAQRFIRLDPHKYYSVQPQRLLQEVALVPANPKWLATLSIFSDRSEYAQYDLLGTDAKANQQDYVDYHVRGIRRLEVVAKRRDANYLSMMIEELPAPDKEHGLMVGRCIHLDTFAPIGTPMAKAQLNHLDLAINVYCDGDRAKRMSNSLQFGKAQDATIRTHLYRIEAVPFPSVFLFADLFFQSQQLLSEWYEAMGISPGM